jgi:hypothetical protein
MAEVNRRLEPAEWLSAVGRDYLDTFVAEGGAAVKVAVVPAQGAAALARRLLDRARATGYVTAQVDAATCKPHLVQQLFCEVARQVEWDALAADFLRRHLPGSGFPLPEDGRLDVESIARAADQDLSLVRQDARSLLTQQIMRDRSMGRQFRLAAAALCRALLEPDDLRRELAEHVVAWLRGELPRIGAIREAFLYQKVNRHTARNLLLSTAAFVRKAGRPGLAVVTDLSRYALPVPREDGLNRYSKVAALDMWEVLRQFVDGTDDMAGCFFCFLVGPEFLEDDHRGLRGYPALHLRLTDDVRDRRRANPLAPMVRIAEDGAW